MKKLITICIFMATAFTLNAQTLSGSCYDDGQGTSSWFTQVDLNATFSFYAKNNSVYIKCSNLKMNVPSNTTYNAYGQTYTKSDLGISQWPQNQKPWSMTINVNGSYNGGNFNKDIFCNVSFTCDEYYIEGIQADKVNLSSFRITSISNFRYNQGGDPQLEEIIKQKNKQKSQTTSSSNTATTSSVAKNPLETSPSTQTNSQIPSLESQYAKLGIPANTPTYTKQELTNQLVTQAGSLVGELLNNWNANQERKEAEDHAEYIAGIRKDRQKNQDKFDFVYLPLMDLAEKGDEDARMTLYFTSKIFQSEFRVPLREQWFQEAVEHNNIDALLMRSKFLFKEKDCTIIIKELEKIANMGSVDAMIMLANLYDLRSDRGPKTGGNDPKKAFEWYLKAAEKGSPNAMYYLGMIYKYGCTKPDGGYEKGWRVKYDDIHDEKIAFDWFTKSIQPDYIQSIFSKSDKNNIIFYKTSYFTPLSYSELANFYVKGKVVPKDISKAKDFELKRSEYTNTQDFEK